MSFPLLLFLAFGLSMDAFAVSVTNGLCNRGSPGKTALYCGLSFGLAQGIMPLIGYWAGHTLDRWIERIDHWVALLLLAAIGGKMIAEAIKPKKKELAASPASQEFSLWLLAAQAVATSIDALAVGVSLGVVQADIVLAVSVIAAVTFCCCFLGVLIGRRFGTLLSGRAEILGGVILIFIGLHIFWEHTTPFFH